MHEPILQHNQGREYRPAPIASSLARQGYACLDIMPPTLYDAPMADDTAETLGPPRAAASAEAPDHGSGVAGVAPADAQTQPGAQRMLDKIVTKVFLWAIPTWVKPNHITVLRLLFIPAILLLLHFEHRVWAVVVFWVAGATDPIDGTMARTRGQTSTFGTYADPIADKLLIASVLAWLGWRYLVVQVLLAFIVLELIVTAVGIPMLLRSKQSQQSNVFGKVKMFVQSLALFLFLLAVALDHDTLIEVSLYLLWVALAFALISGGKQAHDVLRKRRQAS